METSQSNFVGLLLDKRYRILWHILFWMALYIDPFFSILGITPPLDIPWYMLMVGLILDMILVYLNIYVLLPRFLLKGKIAIYIILSLASLALILYFNELFMPTEYASEEDRLADAEFWLADYISSLLNNAFMFGMAVSIKLFKYLFEKEQRIKQINEEKLKTELGFLKNQVNPHFLFNTMNSFYIQAKKKDSTLPEAILSLSDLLRYQIYDTTKEYVSLEKEIEYIRNYLDLENNRRDNLDITIKSTGDYKNVKIAPLLLLPLVENAVKYSQRTDGERSIINISLEVDDRISFAISNTKGKVDQIKSPDSGIGLDNLQKRLDLIYPDDYSYGFKDVDKIYTTSLILGKR